MFEVHRANSRGHADHGWLKTYHSFSFANYHNPKRMSFGALRVLNDDRIVGGSGFGSHPHKDMEIVSIPLEGSLKHEDSAGNTHIIQKGELQIMSAGTGIVHSEFNNSEKDDAAFLQIWIIPNEFGVAPRAQQAEFSYQDSKNKWIKVVSPDGDQGSLKIYQDASFYMASLEAGNQLEIFNKGSKRGLYFFLIEGSLRFRINSGVDRVPVLEKRDGLGVSEETKVEIQAKTDSEVLVMDLPLEI